MKRVQIMNIIIDKEQSNNQSKCSKQNEYSEYPDCNTGENCHLVPDLKEKKKKKKIRDKEKEEAN